MCCYGLREMNSTGSEIGTDVWDVFFLVNNKLIVLIIDWLFYLLYYLSYMKAANFVEYSCNRRDEKEAIYAHIHCPIAVKPKGSLFSSFHCEYQ